MTEIIGEVVEEHGADVEVYHAPTSITLFRSDDPTEVIQRATETANVLKDVVKKQGLIVNISGREHARVEAWSLLGTLVGVFPVCVWSRKLEDGWEARVEARTRDGGVVGAAEAECLRSEKTWKGRDDYALRSMAQTRATSKALRQPLGFVMTLAGFDATPAEEMPRDEQQADEAPLLENGEVDYANVKVHFGKNTETRVGDLPRRSREWYAGDGWAENKADREVTERDRLLRRACRVVSGLPIGEPDGPFANTDSLQDLPF